MQKKYFRLFFCSFLILAIFSISSNAAPYHSKISPIRYVTSTSSGPNGGNDNVDDIVITTPSSIVISPSTTESEIILPPLDDPSKNKVNTPISNPPKPAKQTVSTTKNPLESFINSQKLKSSSKYLVWINTNTQRTHIFLTSKDGFKISKTFICATGKDSTPTIKGVFKAGAKASFVYDKKYNCYLKNVTRIYKGYLMHSVILNSKGKVIDGTLGRKKSHGCVRLSLSDSEWIYKNIPTGTTIFIN